MQPGAAALVSIPCCPPGSGKGRSQEPFPDALQDELGRLLRDHGEDSVEAAKVVVVGAAAAGKSCLLVRLSKDEFLENGTATIGAERVGFSICALGASSANFSVDCWDTAGQERYQSVSDLFYRNGQAIIACFDVSSHRSFSAVRGWIEAAQSCIPETAPLFLVACKLDLRPTCRRPVTDEEASAVAKELGAEYWTTSALLGTRCHELFKRVAFLVLRDRLRDKVAAQSSRGFRIEETVPVEEADRRPLERRECCRN